MISRDKEHIRYLTKLDTKFVSSPKSEDDNFYYKTLAYIYLRAWAKLMHNFFTLYYTSQDNLINIFKEVLKEFLLRDSIK